MTLRTDFNACVNLFQDFIKQHGTMHTSQQLQEVQLAGLPVLTQWLQSQLRLKIITTRNMSMMPSPLKKRGSSMKGVKNEAIRGVPRIAHILL